MTEKIKKRGLKQPYDAEYEKNVYDIDYYDSHEKYYEKAIPFFLSFLEENFQFDSIADIGCGTGAFTYLLQDKKKVYGFDFSVGAENRCRLSQENYYEADLSVPNSTEVARFVDIIISLETYEHIWPEFELIYLNNIFGLTPKYVILSCAKPGQIGRRHVNCKTKEDVTATVKQCYPSYEVREDLMERFSKIKYLASFYRRNTLIFENKGVKK